MSEVMEAESVAFEFEGGAPRGGGGGGSKSICWRSGILPVIAGRALTWGGSPGHIESFLSTPTGVN